jgi:hypothetical protein
LVSTKVVLFPILVALLVARPAPGGRRRASPDPAPSRVGDRAGIEPGDERRDHLALSPREGVGAAEEVEGLRGSRAAHDDRDAPVERSLLRDGRQGGRLRLPPLRGQLRPRGGTRLTHEAWITELYERRHGRWQIV